MPCFRSESLTVTSLSKGSDIFGLEGIPLCPQKRMVEGRITSLKKSFSLTSFAGRELASLTRILTAHTLLLRGYNERRRLYLHHCHHGYHSDSTFSASLLANREACNGENYTCHAVTRRFLFTVFSSSKRGSRTPQCPNNLSINASLQFVKRSAHSSWSAWLRRMGSCVHVDFCEILFVLKNLHFKRRTWARLPSTYCLTSRGSQARAKTICR